VIGILTLQLRLDDCASLKQKRSRIKPLMARLHREFNVSVAEMDAQDSWKDAVIACAMLGNHGAPLEPALQAIAKWVENNWPDARVVQVRIELI
jgi:uncharacterized protein YlxP (DUF503 family)